MKENLINIKDIDLKDYLNYKKFAQQIPYNLHNMGDTYNNLIQSVENTHQKNFKIKKIFSNFV